MAVRITQEHAANDRRLRHLGQLELALRWNISPRTLERWRWLQRGPRYLKVGGRVVYRLADIETYEVEQLRSTLDTASDPDSAG